MKHPAIAAGPQKQLDGFLAKYAPEIASRARAILAKLGKRMPGAIVLVYDNYNALAIGFGGSERASDIVLSVAAFPKWVSLFLMGGPKLKDPRKLLKGSGTRVRHIVLENAAMLDDPAIGDLIDQAIARARVPIDPHAKSRIVIKSISAKQRPRRP